MLYPPSSDMTNHCGRPTETLTVAAAPPSSWMHARVLAACKRPSSGHLSVGAVLSSAASVLFGENVSPEYLLFQDLTLRRIVNRRITNSGASLIANVDNDEAYMQLLHCLEVSMGDLGALFTEGLRLPSGVVGTAEVSYFLRRETRNERLGEAIEEASRVVRGPAGTVIPEELDAAGFDWLWGQLKRLISDERNVLLYREADHLTTISGYIAERRDGEEGETHFIVIAEHDPSKAPTVLRIERFVDVLRTMFASPEAAVMVLRSHCTVALSAAAAAMSPLHPFHIVTSPQLETQLRFAAMERGGA